ncbi:MAG: hypothetical protein LBK22_01970, partial [Tannerella sp.]|nr:hypothetical protein [Tannerella sp.]
MMNRHFQLLFRYVLYSALFAAPAAFGGGMPETGISLQFVGDDLQSVGHDLQSVGHDLQTVGHDLQSVG